MEERLYYMPAEDALQLPAEGIMQLDQVGDLELGRSFAEEDFMSRDQARAMWQERIQQGMHVLTHVRDGRLVCYGWMIPRQAYTYVLKRHRVDLPPDSAGVYNFFVDPEYRQGDYYPNALMEGLQAAARIPGTSRVYLSATTDLTIPLWWVERLGCVHEATYFYDRILWHTRIWKTGPARHAANVHA